MLARKIIINAFFIILTLSIITVYFRYIVLKDFEYETKDISEFTESDL